jgi:hypothetical protein
MGLIAGVAWVQPVTAAKAKAEKSVAEASAVELKALEQAHFRAVRGLEGVLNGGDHLEQPADKEIEAWVKAWVSPKFEFRPEGVKNADPLDEPGGTKALKGNLARKAFTRALAAVRMAAFGKVDRSQVASRIAVSPELAIAATDETPEARQQRLSAAKTLIMSYGRRSTDEKGIPLSDVTTLPDGTKVALNQLASFTHTFGMEWRLTEAGWKIASVEVIGATAIL